MTKPAMHLPIQVMTRIKTRSKYRRYADPTLPHQLQNLKQSLNVHLLSSP